MKKIIFEHLIDLGALLALCWLAVKIGEFAAGNATVGAAFSFAVPFFLAAWLGCFIGRWRNKTKAKKRGKWEDDVAWSTGLKELDRINESLDSLKQARERRAKKKATWERVNKVLEERDEP